MGRSVINIFLILFLVSAFNMSISLRKGRDATRKNDLSTLQKAIDTYYQKYRILPVATDDGEIIGCFAELPIIDYSTGLPLNSTICEWGVSAFETILVMPKDPLFNEGYSYRYISVGNSYEIYVSLEGKDEAEYSQSTALKNLQCGSKVCNYGRDVKYE